MTDWLDRLSYDPLPFLLGSGSAAVVFFTRRDLLEENSGQCRLSGLVPKRRESLRGKTAAAGSIPEEEAHEYALLRL